MDFVEVRGSTVEVAVEAGLAELGLERDEAAITVIEEPAKGFLGLGSKTALVRISPKPAPKKKRSRSRGKGRSGSGEQRSSGKSSSGQGSSGQGGQSRSGGDGRGGRGGGGGSRNQSQRKSGGSREGSRDGSAGGRSGRNRQEQGGRNRQSSSRSEEPVDVAEQAEVAQSFLEGLLESFGLEGTVETRTEEDIIFATVTGQQTEALVGPKAAILEAINELLRTIIQRKTHRRARLRLDIGGYNERRRAALKIYTERLAAQVKEEGGELMLEPMNPAERKVVHDAVAEIKGVRSFSEGEEPHRSVVIALDDSVEDDEDDVAADDSGSDEDTTNKAAGSESSNTDEEDDESSSEEESSDDEDGDPAAETADADSDGPDEGDDADDSESGASDEPVGGLRG